MPDPNPPTVQEIEQFRVRVMFLIQMVIQDDSPIDEIIATATHPEIFKAYQDFRQAALTILPPEIVTKIRDSKPYTSA